MSIISVRDMNAIDETEMEKQENKKNKKKKTKTKQQGGTEAIVKG